MSETDTLELILSSQEDFDPYQLFSGYTTKQLVVLLQVILENQHELERISKNELYRNNLLKLVNFVYLKTLSEKTEASINDKTKHSQKSVFTETIFKRIYNLAS